MIDKTKEQILEDNLIDVGISKGDYATREEAIANLQAMYEEPDLKAVHAGICNAMQAYADQEKRKEAIAFAIWASDKCWLLYPDCDEDEEQGWYKTSDDFDVPPDRMFGGQLYDIYLQSLTT